MSTARSLARGEDTTAQEAWSLEGLGGRFVELSGGAATATLSVAARLVLEAQRGGTLAAWVGNRQQLFFPPDFAAAGIDLAALPVARVENEIEAARVADALLRSGGFALVVMDLGHRVQLPMPIQTRLVGLAKKHGTALVCITRRTESGAPGVSQVSLRGETEKERCDFDRFSCALRVVKDKRGAPGWGHTEVHCGADGLC